MRITLVKTLPLILAAFMINNLTAQQYSFKVLAFSGDVEYKLPSVNTWSKIKTGDNLQNDNQLKLESDSYAALLYNDGRTLEMMKEGIFEVKDLERTIQSSKSTITQRFANFIAEGIIVDKKKGKHMKEFAAVVRVKPFHIESAMPSSTVIMEPEIDLSWYKFPGIENYTFTLINSDDNLIFMDLVGDTTYTLDTEKIKLNKGAVYKWFIADSENPHIISDTNSITIMLDTDKELILDTLRIMNEEIELNETPLNYLALGLFYERNNLNLDVLNQFNKVLSMVPNSEEYKLVIAQFFSNHKLYARISDLLGEEKFNNED